MSGAVQVNSLLFRNYLGSLKILNELPDVFKDHTKLTAQIDLGKPFKVEAPKSLVDRYEKLIETTKEGTRRLAPPLLPFIQLQCVLFGIRILAIGVALAGYPCLAMLVSALQYIVAPCNFFVSVAMFAALAPPLFLGHYAVWTMAQGVAAVLPWWVQPSVPINGIFIVLLIIVDQYLCFRLTTKTPMGAAAKIPPAKLFNHFWFGFLNCKTYEILILVCAWSWGCRINLLVWGLDAYFGLTMRACEFAENNLGTWGFLFYTQHRMGHLPKVYDSAHKFHHTFRDSTAFDAHIYGSGMPEELVCIYVEVLGSAFGLCPMSLGHNGLSQSWANKLGHTRKEDSSGGCNEHVDHHKEHTKNYGICNPLFDMLFNTRCNNDYAEYGAWKAVKREDGENVVFDWEPNTTACKDVSSIYRPNLGRDMAAIAKDVLITLRSRSWVPVMA